MREGWEYKKLGEVGMIVTGTTPSTKDETNYNPHEYNFVKPSDLQSNGITKIDKTEFCVSSKGLMLSRSLPPGSVLVSCIGSIGKVGILAKKACCNQQINAIIPDEHIDSRCLAYAIVSIKYKLEAIANAPVVPIINKTNFSKLVVPIPSRIEQLAIVAELDQINDLIRLKKEQLKEYDNLAQSIFYDMFGDPVENEKGWEVKKLKEVSLSITDGDHMPPPKSDSGIPFLTISDIDKETRILNFGDTFYVPQEYYDKLKDDRKAMMGDLLYTVTGSYGISVEVKTEQPFCFQRHIALIKVNKENILTKFLCYWFLCKSVKFMADRVATGIAQKTVGLNSLRNFDVILPPLPLQQEFSSRIEQIEKLKAEVQKTITDLETLLASRMQYWFE